jgi:hypothetical protein
VLSDVCQIERNLFPFAEGSFGQVPSSSLLIMVCEKTRNIHADSLHLNLFIMVNQMFFSPYLAVSIMRIRICH